MFGELILDPQLPERTSLQQAQGAAKPLHVWPGEAAQEMAGYFDQILDQVLESVGYDASRPAQRRQSPSGFTEAVVTEEQSNE